MKKTLGMENWQPRSTPVRQPFQFPVWMRANQRSLTIALVGFCAFLNLYTPQPLLPLFQQLFHTTEVRVGWLVSATTLGLAIASPWVGVLADRLGRKRVIVPALWLLTVPTFLAATAPDLSWLTFWRFCQGVLMAMVLSVSIAYISEEFAGTGVGKTMAVYITGNVVGGFVGRFLAGVMAEHGHWRWVFGLMGGLTLLGAIAASRWLPASRNFQPRDNLQQSLRAMRSHVQNPRLIAAYAVGFNILFSIVALFTYVNFYLAAPPFQLSPVALGSIFCVYLVGAVTTPIVGRWIDRLGYRRSLLMAIALVCFGALLTLLPLLGLVILGLTCSAAGIFICQSISTSYVGTTAQEARSAATGLYVASYYLGGSVGAIVPGYVWASGGWLSCIGLILAVQLVTVYLTVRFWRQPAGIRG